MIQSAIKTLDAARDQLPQQNKSVGMMRGGSEEDTTGADSQAVVAYQGRPFFYRASTLEWLPVWRPLVSSAGSDLAG